MADKLTLDEVKAMAAQKGLPLSDEEAARLLPALQRSRMAVQMLRTHVTPGLEPRPVFAPEVRP